jgi:hypothetical protein
MSERFHYLTSDAVTVAVSSPDGDPVGDDVTVTAGLGTAWRPPGALTDCSWVGAASADREFALPINPTGAPPLANGVYRVWFRLSGAGVAPLSPLVCAEDQVVIFGRPTP